MCKPATFPSQLRCVGVAFLEGRGQLVRLAVPLAGHVTGQEVQTRHLAISVTVLVKLAFCHPISGPGALWIRPACVEASTSAAQILPVLLVYAGDFTLPLFSARQGGVTPARAALADAFKAGLADHPLAARQ